jgi:hypothetical protein
VFFVWGALCTAAFVYAYFLVPVSIWRPLKPRFDDADIGNDEKETKGLTLEQVDRMFEETTPRKSAAWKPSQTFAVLAGGASHTGQLDSKVLQEVKENGTAL